MKSHRFWITSMVAGGLAAAALPPPAAAIDWRGLVHGNAAAPPKSPPPAQRARLMRAEGVQADAMVEAFLNDFADALMARDGQRMLPRLSKKYVIAGLPASEDPRVVFVQAIERVPGPSEMEIKAVSQEKEGDRLATVEFRYAGAPAKSRRIRLDAEGRLVASDLFNIRVEQR